MTIEIHNFTRLSILILLVIFTVSFTFAGETIVLIDGSASMKGFFVGGRSSEIHALIQSISEVTNCKNLILYKYFRDRHNQIKGGGQPYSLPISDFGGITLLNKCYEDARETCSNASIIYFITDNVQDPEGLDEEQGDINRFYNHLRSKVVKWIHLFPISLKFDGPIFGRDGKTKICERFPGENRGLIIYSILLDLHDKSNYLCQIENFSQRTGYKAIDAKLLEGEVVEVVPIQIEVINSRDNSNTLILKDGKLESERRIPFSEGEKIEGHFEIGFKSKLNFVQIDKPTVKVELIEDFKFLGLHGASSDFTADAPEVNWSPAILTHSIIPGDITGSHPRVRIEINFEKGVQFKKSLGALLRYLSMSKAGEFKGTIRIALEVKSDNIKLVDEIVQEYAVSPDDYFNPAKLENQSKILNLNQFFKSSYEFSDVLAESYPVHFQVNYPIWPLFLYLLLLTLVLFFLVKLWRKRARYILIKNNMMDYSIQKQITEEEKSSSDDIYSGYTPVTGSTKDYSEQIFLNISLYLGSYIIFEDGIALASIRRLPPFGFFVTARSGFRVNSKKFSFCDALHRNRIVIEKEEIKSGGINNYNDYDPSSKKSAKNDYDYKNDYNQSPGDTAGNQSNSRTTNRKNNKKDSSNFDEYPDYTT